MFIGIYAGVFATAMGFMYLEVFASGVLSFVLGPHSVYSTIAMAMLGMGAAGTAVMFTRPTKDLSAVARRAALLSLLAAMGTLLFLVAAAYIKARINARLDEASGAAAAFKLWAQALSIGDNAFVGVALAIPYFFHGCSLAYVFRNAGDMPVAKLYGADLLGACAGALTSVGLGSYFRDYASSQIAIIAIPMLAAGAFFLAVRPSRATTIKAGAIAAAAVAICVAAGLVGTLEPELHLRTAARLNWQLAKYDAEELAHWWTFNGRIATLRLRHPDDREPYYVMVHGEGEGHARVFNANTDHVTAAHAGMSDAHPTSAELVRRRLVLATSASIAGCSADNVLILLAGAGAEMILVDQLTGGKANITGVEMAPEMVEWASSQEPLGVRQFLSQPRHHMVIAEAREFLARDRKHYDCITLSFPGAAGRSYANGSAANLPDHIFTREGIEDLLGHLAPNGQLAIYFGNVVKNAVTAYEALGPTAARDKAFIIVERQASPNQEIWSNLGPYLLLVKPAGFSREDVAKMRSLVEPLDGKITYEPYAAPDPTNTFSAVLHAQDPVRHAAELQEKYGINLEPATDDKPFPFDLVPTSSYMTSDFWSGTPPAGLASDVRAMWEMRRVQMFLLLAMCVAALVVMIGPLVAFRRRLQVEVPRWNDVVYFAGIGGGFMLIEMGLLHKLRLLVGTPGLTIALVLGSLVLFTGLGSLLSNRWFATGRLTLRKAALGVVLCGVLFIVLTELGFPYIVGAPRYAKLLIAFLSPALPALFMGQLYPQGLSALRMVSPAHVPFCMGVNALAGTIATGAGIVLAPVIGFRALVLVGAVLYVVVMALPQRATGGASRAA